MAKPDYRSREAAEYRRWYGLKRWKDKRQAQLQAEPWCAFCTAMGNDAVPATVADHVVPHRGDPELFWYGELQSLCEPHHSITKQQIETMGYSTICGSDGWPLDVNHPANKR